jgi:hypothetical protein
MPGVRGIGVASLLSDLGHEVPTALLPRFITFTHIAGWMLVALSGPRHLTLSSRAASTHGRERLAEPV